MEEPSTRRNAVVIAPTPYRTGFAGPTTNGQRGSNVHDLFSVRNMFFCAGFENHRWPVLRSSVSYLTERRIKMQVFELAHLRA
jgi:hypothetical protein